MKPANGSSLVEAATRDATASGRVGARCDDALLIICGLACGSGLIHVLAAIQHVQQYALYAVFFALLAPMQLGWAIFIYRGAGRRVLGLGAGVSLSVATLWVVSRTLGLPVGPEHWSPETVGPLDLIATADELVLAMLVGLRLLPVFPGAAFRAAQTVLTSLGVTLVLASSLVLVAGGHAH